MNPFNIYLYPKLYTYNGQYGYVLYTNSWDDEPSLSVFMVPTNWLDPELQVVP